MKRLGDVLHQDPTPAQAEAMHHVLDLALAWVDGQLDLAAVRTLCSGFERYQAMRFADQKSAGYQALREMVEALVADDQSVIPTRHGLVLGMERYDPGVKEVTNYRGERVVIWPLCWMNEEPQYPPVHLAPGEERREIERAIQSRYDAYRKEKKRRFGWERKEAEHGK